MVILKIHNDGKQKHQSFEAWLDEIDCERGYGSTQEQAISEYKRELDSHQKKIFAAAQDLAGDSFETLMVDWRGQSI